MSKSDELPKQKAAELRDAGLLGKRYGAILNKHGVAHVSNHWCSMPGLAEQDQRLEAFTAPFTVLRLLTPLKMTYEAAKKPAEPYNKIVGELPEMKAPTVELISAAIVQKIRAYVLVNNRAEGNSPFTIQERSTNCLQRGESFSASAARFPSKANDCVPCKR